MLAIIGFWNVESVDCFTDNTREYMFLLLFKLGLDAGVFYLCHRKLYDSFLGMCSLSIILADMVMVFLLAAVWFLEVDNSPAPLCFLLANASATYAAMPLPMMSLGLMDYCLEDTYICNQRAFYKNIRNAVIVLLGWMVALIYSLCSVKSELRELEYMTWKKTLVCEVEETTLISYFILVLFTVVISATVPFWSNIPHWLKEADRLSEARVERENQPSELYISTDHREIKIIETKWPPPPLWVSLTLGFGVSWMPYLMISVACLVFHIGVPAYININVLWLECTNSLLTGVVFWIKGNTLGPYNSLPENVCSWHVYWHLSKGTGYQHNPVPVFNPSKGKRNTLFYV